MGYWAKMKYLIDNLSDFCLLGLSIIEDIVIFDTVLIVFSQQIVENHGKFVGTQH